MATRRVAPMVTSIEEVAGGFVVRIEHDDRQSWSRAVDPRATRLANEHTRAVGRAAWCGRRRYSEDGTGSTPGRSVSSFWWHYC